MTTVANYLQQNYLQQIYQQNKAFAEAINPDQDSNSVRSYPIIMSQPQLYSSKTHSPYIGINPISSQIVSNGFYKD